MGSLDERSVIVTEMMQTYVQQVSAERVVAYLKHLGGISTEILRAACAGAVESGQQRGVPTVADIRRRAGELQRRGSTLGQPIEGEDITEQPQHAGTVERLRHWNYSSHVIEEVLRGARPCPTEPKRFSRRGIALMERIAAKRGKTLAEMGIVLHGAPLEDDGRGGDLDELLEGVL